MSNTVNTALRVSDAVNTALRVDESALDALCRESGPAPAPVRRAPAQPRRALDHAGRTAPRAVLAVPSREPFVRTCRAFAKQVLSHWDVSGAARDSAVLVIDELAANAVQHGHADTTVILSRVGDILLISVTDSGAAVPHSRDGADSDERARPGDRRVPRRVDRGAPHHGRASCARGSASLTRPVTDDAGPVDRRTPRRQSSVSAASALSQAGPDDGRIFWTRTDASRA
ncbi:ATP-binding protein [Streptomyces platensis]|uniref:ATP-binding protein n=1 Tax=Streptomyces platensis TaxID=58346 RepID=UPI00368C8A80